MIHICIPWNTYEDLSISYNTFMEGIKDDDDFGCFIDGDAMFTTKMFGLQLEQVVAANPHASFLTSYVSRLNTKGAGMWQILSNRWCKEIGVSKRQVQQSNDIEFHRNIGEKLWKINVTKTMPIKLEDVEYKYMSGTLILLKKSLWKKIGGFKKAFEAKPKYGHGGEKLLSIDNQLHRDVILAEEDLHIMQGMYLYHWYRNQFPDLVKCIGPHGGVRIIDKHDAGDRFFIETNKYHKRKKVIYTALVGDYDTLKEWKTIEGTPNTHGGWDQVCFTDNPDIKSDFWDVRLIPKEEMIIDDTHFKGDKTKTARKYKCLPHKYLPEYECSLWVDASFELRPINRAEGTVGCVNYLPFDFWKQGMKGRISSSDNTREKLYQFVLMAHPHRKTVREELDRCVKSKKDDIERMEQQVTRYYKETTNLNQLENDVLKGLDNCPSNPLVETGFLYRCHQENHIKKFNEMWWKEIDNGSKRDQLAFNYCALALKLPFRCVSREKVERHYIIHKHSKNSEPAKLKAKVGVEELG